MNKNLKTAGNEILTRDSARDNSKNKTPEVYTFIAVKKVDDEYILSNPKRLMSMTEEKGLGSISWWRRILSNKTYPCFIYNPDEVSLFRKHGKVNKLMVDHFVEKFGGVLE